MAKLMYWRCGSISLSYIVGWLKMNTETWKDARSEDWLQSMLVAHAHEKGRYLNEKTHSNKQSYEPPCYWTKTFL